MANTKITTNVIADGAITSAKLDSSSLSIPSTATATTQSAGDNSTKVATTAYVETAVSNLVSAAPAALDTLDELAAALGDDANFATTVTDSLALKAPLASPDFTGDVTFDTSTLVVDSTNNRVGIGIASPSHPLHVSGASGATQAFFNTTSGNTNFQIKVTEDAGTVLISKDNTAARSLSFQIGESNVAMTIDTSGNVLVGKTSHDNGATAGIELEPNGQLNVSVDGSFSRFNRLTSDGVVIDIKKDGTSVGSIGTLSWLIGQDSGDAFNSGALFRGQTTGAGYIQMKIGDTASGGILIGDTTDDFRGGLISYGANHGSFPNKTIIFANNQQAITASTSGVRLNGNSIARDPLHVHRASTGDCQIHMTNSNTGSSSSDGMTIFANSTASGIWQRENCYFRIATNNAERFRLAANGELTLKSDTDVIATFMNNSDNDHNFKFNLVDASDLAVMYLNGKDGGDNKFIIGYGSTHSSTPNMLALKSNTSSGELGFFTDATQRMHITPTGKVGINKEASTWLFDIDAPDQYIASFDGSNNTGIIINSGSSTTGDIVGYSNSASTYNTVNIRAASGVGLCVDTSNQVGIGVASPSYSLDVQNSATDFEGIRVLNTNSASSPTTSSILMGITNSVRSVYTKIETEEIGNDSNGTDLVFYTTPSATATLTEQMRLTSNGGLALGFDSTDAKIDASGYIRSKHATTNGLLLNTGNDQWAIRNVSSSLSFEDDGTQRFVIDPSGRFAMGNTPSISNNYILSIDSDASGQAAGIHFTHGTKNLYLGYNSTSATNDAEMWNAAGGYLRFATDNSERMRIHDDGKISINETADAGLPAQLQVNSGGRVINATVSNTGFTSNNVSLRVERSANSGYQFLLCRSGGRYDNTAGDTEFNLRGDGNGYADASWNGGGADYAEYFEWQDGNPDNEDRVGYAVSLVGNKIKIAEAGEEVIGVISGNPSVVGDTAWNDWQDKYLKDDFGRYLWEEYADEDGNTTDDNGDLLKRRVLNPDYDDSLEYQPREDRQEWDVVGLMGKLRVRVGQQTNSNWIKLQDISDTVEEWLVK